MLLTTILCFLFGTSLAQKNLGVEDDNAAPSTEAFRVSGVSALHEYFELDGNGITIAVFDSGHPFLEHESIAAASIIIEGEYEPNDHGTDVCAMIIGRDSVCYSRGAAPAAEIVAYATTQFDQETRLMLWEESILEGAVLANWSFTGGTNDILLSTNAILANHPEHLLCLGAGNNDNVWGTVSNEQKNGLSVGSVDFDLSPSGATSFGPANDGRLKPDIVSFGSRVWLPWYQDDLLSTDKYHRVSGTSFASPMAAATFALVQQFNTEHGALLSAPSLKALSILTAKDLGAEGPDFRFGHGLLSLENLLSVLVSHYDGCSQVSTFSDTLSQNEVHDYTIEVGVDGQISAVLCWLDDPSSLSLVNDLDLRLTSSDGTIYYPWGTPPQQPYLGGISSEVALDLEYPAIREDNVLDNIEKIEYTDLAPGEYTMTVSHKGSINPVNGTGGQPYVIWTSQLSNIHLDVSTPILSTADVLATDLPEDANIEWMRDGVSLGSENPLMGISKGDISLITTYDNCTVIDVVTVPCSLCHADINLDGIVNIFDLLIMLTGIGNDLLRCDPLCMPADGAIPFQVIDVADMLYFLNVYGSSCEE